MRALCRRRRAPDKKVALVLSVLGLKESDANDEWMYELEKADACDAHAATEPCVCQHPPRGTRSPRKLTFKPCPLGRRARPLQ